MAAARIATDTIARLWVLSDLHLEAVTDPDTFAPGPPEFDILIGAGNVWRADPARASHVPRRLAGTKPVACVLGNLEHWNSMLGERLPAARKAAEAAGVTLLQGDAVMLAGCRFVGTTRWTDDARAGRHSGAAERDWRSDPGANKRRSNKSVRRSR